MNRAVDVVEGVTNSPLVNAVYAAEGTSLVTNLGTAGIGYINGDLTVALARLPVDEWIYLQADSHWVADGISTGSATLYDRVGAFGTGVVTAVSNPAAQIDFADDTASVDEKPAELPTSFTFPERCVGIYHVDANGGRAIQCSHGHEPGPHRRADGVGVDAVRSSRAGVVAGADRPDRRRGCGVVAADVGRGAAAGHRPPAAVGLHQDDLPDVRRPRAW